MTTDDVRTTVVEGFRKVEERLERVDQRLDTMDQRFEKVDERFSHIDDKFVRLDQAMKDMRAEIKAEGETTRRHFNVMVERVEAAVRIVAEVNAHQGTVLGNHEVRLQAIEKRG
jgi:archaellum component FlaC